MIANDALFATPRLRGYTAGAGFRKACENDPKRLAQIRYLSCFAWAKWECWFEHYSLPNLREVELANDALFEDYGCFWHSTAYATCRRDHSPSSPDRRQCTCECRLCGHPFDPPPQLSIDHPSVLSKSSALTKATLTALTTMTACDTISETLEVVTLLLAEVYPSNAQSLRGLDSAFPALRHVSIELIPLHVLAAREQMEYEDSLNDPTFGPAVYDVLNRLPHLTSLSLRGACQDVQEQSFVQLVDRVAHLHLDLVSFNDLGYTTAEPALGTGRCLETLSLRVSRQWDTTDQLFALLDSGGADRLRRIKLFSTWPILNKHERKQVARDLRSRQFTVPPSGDWAMTLATRDPPDTLCRTPVPAGWDTDFPPWSTRVR